MVKVLHVITGLSTGGAEMMLYRLLGACNSNRISPAVISMTPPGPLEPRIADLGIPVDSLHMRRGVPDPRGIVQLAAKIRKFAPDVVQTWMYHSNLIGGLAAKLAGGPPVIWSIHNGTQDRQMTSASGVWSNRICAMLSRVLPKKIICCSESAQTIHQSLGYATAKMCVIPNGFDLKQFKPASEARSALRAELGIKSSDSVAGLVGRFDPQKDHGTFVRASALLRERRKDLYFLLCGEGVTWTNTELRRWIEGAGMRDRFHLLGRRDDLPRITAGLDVSCLSSAYGEAFPLVVGEAMACGVPCVVTDVGDCAIIVGDTGVVTAPNDATGLARGIERILDMPDEDKRKLRESARRRIQENFSLERISSRYEELYEQVVQKGNLGVPNAVPVSKSF
jgi:glycosyltransferase involved in cell wall biosynthesis